MKIDSEPEDPSACDHAGMSRTRYVGCGGRSYWICDACEQVVEPGENEPDERDAGDAEYWRRQAIRAGNDNVAISRLRDKAEDAVQAEREKWESHTATLMEKIAEKDAEIARLKAKPPDENELFALRRCEKYRKQLAERDALLAAMADALTKCGDAMGDVLARYAKLKGPEATEAGAAASRKPAVPTGSLLGRAITASRYAGDFGAKVVSDLKEWAARARACIADEHMACPARDFLRSLLGDQP